jgi:hypothetical protein
MFHKAVDETGVALAKFECDPELEGLGLAYGLGPSGWVVDDY